VNNNNRPLIFILCVAAGAGLLMLGLNLFLWPLLEYDREIDEKSVAVAKKFAQVQQILRDKARLQQWRTLSLPGVENLPKTKGVVPNPQQDRETAILQAQDRYVTFLRDLIRKHKLVSDRIPRPLPTSTKNIAEVRPGVPVYTPLQFEVDAARGTWDQIVKLLDDVQKAPVLHRIRKLTIKQTPTTAGRKASEPLTLTMTLEALMVNGSDKRGDSLFAVAQKPAALDAALIAARRFPTGLSILPWGKIYAAGVSAKRNYADLARKNIFEGGWRELTDEERRRLAGELSGPRPTPDLMSKAYLTDVTIGASTWGTLRNRLTEQSIKLRTWQGWNWIPLLKSADGGTLVRGEVLRMDTRGVIFRVLLVSQSPAEEPEARRYKKKDVIYSLYKKDAEALVYGSVIRAEDVQRTFKVPVTYWESLLRDGLVTVRGKGFAFRKDLVRGKVLRSDDFFVLIQLDQRYCGFRDGGDDEGIRPHQGYCFLPVGESVSLGLRTPLMDSEVRELQEAVAQGP
jgi:hypothetical protein